MSLLRWTAWLLTAAGLGAAAPARAAQISGRVLVAGRPAPNAVVSVEGTQRNSPAEAKTYVLDHRDLILVPHVIALRSGSSVRFENSDGMPCRVYSISPAGMFVLKPQPAQPLVVAFDRPGVIEVRCAEHGRLLAYIVVKDNPYYAVTDERGRYQIKDVPAGRHSVQAWWEGSMVETATVELGTAARRTLDFKASRLETKDHSVPPALEGDQE